MPPKQQQVDGLRLFIGVPPPLTGRLALTVDLEYEYGTVHSEDLLQGSA